MNKCRFGCGNYVAEGGDGHYDCAIQTIDDLKIKITDTENKASELEKIINNNGKEKESDMRLSLAHWARDHAIKRAEAAEAGLDIIDRSMHGEYDDTLANDYGGTGYEQQPVVKSILKRYTELRQIVNIEMLQQVADVLDDELENRAARHSLGRLYARICNNIEKIKENGYDKQYR